MKQILLIDNYDSFTYNLALLVLELTGKRPVVFRNDAISLEAVEAYDKILLSPGPGIPSEAGLMPAIIKAYASRKSILGICLGHQAIAEAFGASLENVFPVCHGVATPAYLCASDKLFDGVPDCTEVGRYHSWMVSREQLPEELVVTAKDAFGNIMALRHHQFDVKGIQFHPESILTPHGKTMMANWLNQ